MKILELRGTEVFPYLDDLAELKVDTFSEWPHLRQSDFLTERRAFEEFFSSLNSFAVILKDSDGVFGAATAVWLPDARPIFREPFRIRKMPAQKVCFLSESMLKPEARGQGFGSEFMKRREAFARSLNSVTTAAFCTIARADNDPRRPKKTRDLTTFWKEREYRPVPGMTTTETWPDVGEVYATEKKMQFWVKALDPFE